MELRQHVLAERLDGFAGDDLVAHDGLNDDLCGRGLVDDNGREGGAIRTEHLAVDVFFEFGHPMPAEAVDLCGVDDATDGINGLFVDKHLKLDQTALSPACIFVI